MIDYETYARIKHLHEQKGLTAPQITRELNLDDRTVRRWLAAKQYVPRKAVIRPSMLDPFKSTIIRMIESYPYTAQQLWQRLREEGFTGGYTAVKKFVRTVRPKREKAYLTLAFAPGECAQVDWGSYGTVRVGETTRRLSVFVMVLCYSRQLSVEFTVSQTMEHFLTCHQNAFAAFGGVPGRIMVDNLKSAVLKHAVAKHRFLIHDMWISRSTTASASPPAAWPRGTKKGAWRTGSATSKRTSSPAPSYPSLRHSIPPPRSGLIPWPMSEFTGKPGKNRRRCLPQSAPTSCRCR